MDAVERDFDGGAADGAVGARSERCRDVHVDHRGVARRCHVHAQRIGAGGSRAGAFDQRERSGGLPGDADRAGGAAARHHGHAAGQDAVEGRVAAGQGVVDIAAGAVGGARHDGAGDVAADVETVVAQAADEAGDYIGRGRQHIEMVVAFEAVDLEFFGIAQFHVQACALHALVGDDEGVGRLGAQHHHGIGAGAAVDADRRADVVLDMVVAGAAAERRIAHRKRAAIRAHEGAHDELVVAVFAEQLQRGLVAVHREAVVAVAAEHRGGVADALAQETDRGRDGLDVVADAHLRADAVQAEHLAELEAVAAGAAVDGGQGSVVVDVEGVVAVESADIQAAVGRAVVIDPFHRVRTGVQQRDEIGAQQEGIGRGGAVDQQAVRLGGVGAAVVDVDDVVGGAVDVDGDDVVAALAVDPDLVAHAVPHVRQGVQGADRDPVVAGAAVERDGAGDRQARRQEDGVVAGPALHVDLRRMQGAGQDDGVVLHLARNVDAGARRQAAGHRDDAAQRVDVGLAGRRRGAELVALVIAFKADAAGRRHERARFDGQVVAGQDAHVAAGAGDGDAGLDQEVVGHRFVLVVRHQDDVAHRRQALCDRQRAHGRHADDAAGNQGRAGAAIDRVEAHRAGVDQPGAAQRRLALQRAEHGAQRVRHAADVVAGEQVGLASGDVVPGSAGAIEDAAFRRGDKGGVGGAGLDLVDFQVAVHFDQVRIQEAGQGQQAALRVDIEVVAGHAHAAQVGRERD